MMEFEDLIDTHTVMYTIDVRNYTSINAALFSTADIDNIMTSGAFHYFVTLFQFDSEIATSDQGGFEQRFIWDANATWGSYTGTTWYSRIAMSTTQDQSGKVRLRLRCRLGSGTLYSGYVYCDVGKTYGILTYLDPPSGYLSARIYCYDDTGYGTYVTHVSTGASVTHAGSPLPISHSVNYTSSGLQGQLRIYETCFLGRALSNPNQCVPSLWSAHRVMYWTYYEYAYYTPYLMPPKAIMDGSAYDRAAALYAQIEVNLDEISTLTTSLATAQSDLTELQAKITTGFVAYINTCFATITSWITGIDVEILKIAGAFGAEGKFTLATLNAALTDIINAGFDAIEEAM